MRLFKTDPLSGYVIHAQKPQFYSVYILSNRKDFQYLTDGINQHTASNIYKY